MAAARHRSVLDRPAAQQVAGLRRGSAAPEGPDDDPPGADGGRVVGSKSAPAPERTTAQERATPPERAPARERGFIAVHSGALSGVGGSRGGWVGGWGGRSSDGWPLREGGGGQLAGPTRVATEELLVPAPVQQTQYCDPS